MNRLPESQLFESNAAPAMTTTRFPTTNQRWPNQDHHREGSSVLLPAADWIEPLAPPAVAQRRRSSSISFERHPLSLFQDLARELDDDDDDTESETESDVELSLFHVLAREHDEDSDTESVTESDDDDDVNPSDAPEEADEGEATAVEDSRVRLDAVRIHRRLSRRVSELSLDLDDIREAVAELEEEDDDDEEADGHGHGHGRNRPLFRHFSSSSNDDTSLMARAEEEILAKAVREGKILVTRHEDDVDDETTTPPEDRNNAALLLPRGHRGSSRRIRFGRRSALSGGGSASTQSSGRRRISFNRRTTLTTMAFDGTSAAVPSSAVAALRSGDTPEAGASGAARSRVQDDILTALSELRGESSSDGVERLRGRPDVAKPADSEKEEEEGPEQQGDDTSAVIPGRRVLESTGRTALSIEMREA